MAHNYLEQLVAEWYEYRGYFVRRNVLVGRRQNGGYECELDVVALHPQKKHLVHVEPTMDTYSWSVRERRFSKKFNAGRRYIPQLFEGLDVPPHVEQIALLGYGSAQNHQTIGGGQVLLVSELLRHILTELRSKRLVNQAVPEQFIILRSFQFVSEYREFLQPALNP